MTTNGAGRGCPIPVADFDPSVADVAEALTLPPECYTSNEFYEFEKDAIFFREWLCLGRAEQIPNPGDYFTITIANEPLIVVRDREGEVAVMSAVCRHRGTVIADGAGNCGHAFRCPYHWWTYDLHGKLVGAPDMSRTAGFDKQDVRLPRLKVEIWKGFVFANFDVDAPALAPRLERFEPLLANYRVESLVTTPPEVMPELPFNWKVMLENGVEPYHAPFLHSAYVPMPPAGSRGNFLEWDEDAGAIASIVSLDYADSGINPSYKTFFPIIEGLTDEERRRWVFASAPPNLMFFWQPDMLSWFLLVPNRPQTVTLMWAYCVPGSTTKLPAFQDLLEMTRAGIDVFNRQDFAINASVQRGYNSRFAVRGRYSHQEELLVQVNRWLVKRYRAQEARSREVGRLQRAGVTP